MEVDDLTLARAQRGDPSAQEAVLRRCAPPLRGLIRRFVPPAEVDDALQGLFLKLLCALPRYRTDGPAHFSTWTYAVAHRWLLERHRKARPDWVGLDAAEHIADAGPSAQIHLEQRDVKQALDEAVAALSEPLRRAFVLARIHGLPLEEIAIG